MSKFRELLAQSNNSVTKSRADRWSRAAERESNSLVDKLLARKERIEESLEQHMDLSPSNDLTTANRAVEFDGKSFMNTYHSLSLDAEMANRELTIARAAHASLFGTEAATEATEA